MEQKVDIVVIGGGAIGICCAYYLTEQGRHVSVYFPEFDYKSLDLIEIWQGLRPCTPDGLSCLGRLPRYDNVPIAAGHGMLGISLAPTTGKIVAQLKANETPAIDLTPLSVERFH